MGDDSNKRKGGPGGERGSWKKSKQGGGNKWQTPNQRARMAAQIESGSKIGTGDAGIWVTYARGQRPRAVREFVELCEEYAESIYGLKPFHSDDAEEKDEDAEPQDIESSIAAELSAMKSKAARPQDRIFSAVNTGIECVFFLKVKQPVNAVELVRRMCLGARDGGKGKRTLRYVNRLAPVVGVDRVSEGGMEKVGEEVLGEHFNLKSGGNGEEKEACTYAIRHNVRHNSELRSEELIKKVAGLVDDRHKVNLTKPDKVILVEVFQLFIGMSVVDGMEWESLKRYNMNELYKQARGNAKKGDEKEGDDETKKEGEEEKQQVEESKVQEGEK